MSSKSFKHVSKQSTLYALNGLVLQTLLLYLDVNNGDKHYWELCIVELKDDQIDKVLHDMSERLDHMDRQTESPKVPYVEGEETPYFMLKFLIFIAKNAFFFKICILSI